MNMVNKRVSNNDNPIRLDNIESAMDGNGHGNLGKTDKWGDIKKRWTLQYICFGTSLVIILLIWLVLDASDTDSNLRGIYRCFDITRYPGYNGKIDISGKVCITQTGVGNIYHYQFQNLPVNSDGGWHVHSGTSCEESGGHYQGQLSYDPWVSTSWSSDAHGIVDGISDMSNIAQNIDGRNLVVHAPDGTRVGCGEIPGVAKHTLRPTPVPTPVPTVNTNCRDNNKFSDENGNGCIDWIGYNCKLATLKNKNNKIRPISEVGRQKLLKNCPESCRLCVTAPPGLVPSDKCTDKNNFVTETEEKCQDFYGYNCYQTALQYEDMSFRGQLNLIKNCPASCGLCRPEPLQPKTVIKVCQDNIAFRDEDDNPCYNWLGYNCYLASRPGEYTTFKGQQNLLKNCPVSCGLCVKDDPPVPSPENCVDDPTFRSESTESCEDWIGLNCRTASLEFYDEISGKGQYNLLKNCPAACGLCVPEPLEKPKKCVDNRHFRFNYKKGSKSKKCKYFYGYNCQTLAVFTEMSFTDQRNIIKNCPISCGVCHPSSDEIDEMGDDMPINMTYYLLNQTRLKPHT